MIALSALAVLAGVTAGAAAAAYGPGAVLVSADPARLEQSEDNTQNVAISQDGPTSCSRPPAATSTPAGDPAPPGEDPGRRHLPP